MEYVQSCLPLAAVPLGSTMTRTLLPDHPALSCQKVLQSLWLPANQAHMATDIPQSKFQPGIPELWVTSPCAGLSAPGPTCWSCMFLSRDALYFFCLIFLFPFRADFYFHVWLSVGGKHAHSQQFMAAFHLHADSCARTVWTIRRKRGSLCSLFPQKWANVRVKTSTVSAKVWNFLPPWLYSFEWSS